MKNLIWLASYPKSGNTWLRILLESVINNKGNTVDINQLSLSNFSFIPRFYFDEFLELDSTELTISETSHFKRAYYIHLSEQLKTDTFLKTHDANISLKANDLHIVPPEVTKLVIYIVRNPLDVTASFANHFGINIDEAIVCMQNEGFTLFRTRGGITSNVDQVITDWSSHVTSWLDDRNLPVLLVKYEDLLTRPVETLMRVVKGIQKTNTDQDLVEKALENHNFSNLAKQESESGFQEKSVHSPVFFRKGKADSWKEELTNEQVNRIIQAHGSVMTSLGYLPNLKPAQQ